MYIWRSRTEPPNLNLPIFPAIWYAQAWLLGNYEQANRQTLTPPRPLTCTHTHTFASQAPRWSYLLCAIGIFVYQTLDGIDGPQARRTGTSSPLGEYFDHGLDAITTFIYAATAACIPGLQEYPFFLLMLVAAMIHINYVYHWQTYVSGVLYFKL